MATLVRSILTFSRAAKIAITSNRSIHISRILSIATIQKPAPSFKGVAVVDNDFRDIKLEDYRGTYLVLFFYPLDFTFVCPTEIVAFSNRIEEFKAIETELVGVSVDSQYSHLAWIKTPRKDGGLGCVKYPLLSDLTKQMSKDYGVLHETGVSLRGLFIIDREGIVRQITINDLPVGRSVDETLRSVKALQHVEKHGEGCPANWNAESKSKSVSNKTEPKNVQK